MKSAELKRRLDKLGATYKPGKGSHFKVTLKGKTTVLPMHTKEIPNGTLHSILKDLGLK
jgi:mRNA interferase HicA